MSNHKIVFCKVIFAVFFVCFTTLLLYSSDHQLQYASTPESFVKSNSPEKPEIKPKPRTLDHSNLNCYTRPFQEMDYITVKSNKTKFAYVWYATGGNTYLCSALVAMKQMKALRDHPYITSAKKWVGGYIKFDKMASFPDIQYCISGD